MNIHHITEENNELRFTIEGINVSVANALRRCILSDLETTVIDTTNCTIENQDKRIHNEILKQRLRAVPVVISDNTYLPGNYVLSVDVENKTDNWMYVTTEDFKIRDKKTNELLSDEKSRKIFPPNRITGDYILFHRLAPMVSLSIPPQRLRITAEFMVDACKTDGNYSIVNKCSYGYTQDKERVVSRWGELEKDYVSKGMTPEKIEFERKNFYLLDAERIYITNAKGEPTSFDFVVTTLANDKYSSRQIIIKACVYLQNMFVYFLEAVKSDMVSILPSETSMEYSTMANSYDIRLENGDYGQTYSYTFGPLLEYLLHEEYVYEINPSKDKPIAFCGFVKYHPHDKHSIVRIAFSEKTEMDTIKEKIKHVCTIGSDLYKSIFEKMGSGRK